MVRKNRKSTILTYVILMMLGVISCVICTLVNAARIHLDLPDLPTLFSRIIYPNDLQEPDPKVSRTISKSDAGLELLWPQSGIRTTKNSHISVAAANGVLFYIASMEQSAYQEVIALDAQDGETVFWRSPGPGTTNLSVLSATSSAVYMGGNGKVAAYALRTGEELWSKSFPFQRTVTNLQVVDDLVYVKAVSSFRALLQAHSGQEMTEWEAVPGFSREYFENKTLTLDTEFDNGPGTIYAKDRQTGHTLWQANTLSNAVITESTVYLIVAYSNKLNLQGVRPRSGEVTISVTFEPLTSADYLKLYDYPHRLALDKELGILYAFLRDSRQLFAFKIANYSDK